MPQAKQGFLPFSEIHPDYYRIPIADRERRKALVLTVALGESGLAVVRDSLGAKSGNMARAFGGVIPTPVLKTLNQRLVKTYFKKYTLQKLPLAAGKPAAPQFLRLRGPKNVGPGGGGTAARAASVVARRR